MVDEMLDELVWCDTVVDGDDDDDDDGGDDDVPFVLSLRGI